MDLKKILPTDGPPVEEVLKYVEKYKKEIIVIKKVTLSFGKDMLQFV